MKVLVVVEDDEEMRMIIGRVLARDERIEGHGAAATALEAVEEARQMQPDLVILDHFIEGDVMGLEAAPLIKAAAPTAKILLFTAHDLATEASREAAIDAFLPKDRLENLLDTVRSLLGLATTA